MSDGSRPPSQTPPGKGPKGQGNDPKKEKFPGSVFLWVLLFATIFTVLRLGGADVEPGAEKIPYSEFFALLNSEDDSTSVATAQRSGTHISGTLVNGQKYYVAVPDQDTELEYFLKRKVPHYEILPEKTALIQFLYTILGPVLFVGLFWLLIYRGGGTGRIMAFGKTRSKQEKVAQKISFKDVAGVDEAKEELQEVVEYLKDPQRFQKLGGKIPKGVILVGPPGTGKTLLARAISGEAEVPFFSLSGSDFVEMFVGVGASRVRDLFEQAKKAARAGGKGAIIFIDEIDAVGRQRFAGIGGGHDEREQTLNALLVEMDGFGTQEAVILIAATNRPDVLDPALLRPGRFDRHIVVPRPDIVGREAILKVHASKVKLDPTADLKVLARQTTYFSGADLANLINEAALLAARLNKESVGMQELQESIERVMAGPQRKSRKMSDKEKGITAYHEAGHALVSLHIPDADPLHKVTIIPRGMAGGYTLLVPEEERHYSSKKNFMAELTIGLGGRAAEEAVFEDVTTGASQDLRQVTEKARDMVCRFGMSKKIGNVVYGRDQSMVFLGRDIGEDKNYSEETARVIDSEINGIIETCYKRAEKIMADQRWQLDVLAKALMEKETLEVTEVRELLKMPLPGESGDA